MFMVAVLFSGWRGEAGIAVRFREALDLLFLSGEEALGDRQAEPRMKSCPFPHWDIVYVA
jgi:hypothetical protein